VGGEFDILSVWSRKTAGKAKGSEYVKACLGCKDEKMTLQ